MNYIRVGTTSTANPSSPNLGEIILDLASNTMQIYTQNGWMQYIPLPVENLQETLERKITLLEKFLESKNIPIEDYKEFESSIEVCEKIIQEKI